MDNQESTSANNSDFVDLMEDVEDFSPHTFHEIDAAIDRIESADMMSEDLQEIDHALQEMMDIDWEEDFDRSPQPISPSLSTFMETFDLFDFSCFSETSDSERAKLYEFSLRQSELSADVQHMLLQAFLEELRYASDDVDDTGLE